MLYFDGFIDDTMKGVFYTPNTTLIAANNVEVKIDGNEFPDNWGRIGWVYKMVLVDSGLGFSRPAIAETRELYPNQSVLVPWGATGAGYPMFRLKPYTKDCRLQVIEHP